jgi:YfiR/HmsC-like
MRKREVSSLRFLNATVFALVLLALCLPSSAEESQPIEYQLKAAFLFNFVKFIDWPPDSFGGPQAPFSICILGGDPFGHLLDDALAGKTVAGRAILVRRCQTDPEARTCQVIFLSRAQARRLPEVLQALRGTSVLLVGESDGFAAGGGSIEFYFQDDRVRFRINPDAASRAGLTISSKLLALAVIVHDQQASGKS